MNQPKNSTRPLAEWRELLSSEAYAVLFEEATERAGTSSLNEEKRAGTFICTACHLSLFESAAKYESGTGWHSFYAPLEGSLETRTDYKLLLPRTEYHCMRCGGHQGHVFKDGPSPTGQRYLQQRCCPQVRAADRVCSGPTDVRER